MGRRCDQCQHGFWNFTEDNPDGCQPCSCHPMGTYENQGSPDRFYSTLIFFFIRTTCFLVSGCNVYSGECVCKRYVTGRDCDSCLPEHWGLSENNRDGCKPCDCDPGGSYDNNCDIHSGQCKCRPHVNGRTCSQPVQGFFAGAMDFQVYEAEYSSISDRGQLTIREPYR